MGAGEASFRGGPADGMDLRLPLGRAPFYVRVAVEPNVGECAVMSGAETASEDEDVAVYVRPGEAMRQVVEAGGRPVVTACTYVWLEDVEGLEFRRADAWQRWATAQPEAGKGRVGETVWEPPGLLEPPADLVERRAEVGR